MNIIKRAVQSVINTMYYRSHPQARIKKRQWDAAKSNRLTSSWTVNPSNVDSLLIHGLKPLIARSQEQAQNNDYVRKFIKMVRNNVVGKDGFILKANSIGIKGKPDVLANNAINASYKAWSKRGVCEASGMFSLRVLYGMLAESAARDGSIILQKIKGWDKNKFRFAIKVIDTAALDIDYNKDDMPNGHKIRMGIELDADRRPVNYYFLKDTDKQNTITTSVTGKYTIVPADEIIHAFLPEWINQTRGIPWTATGLLRLNMLEGYEEAELVAARVGSSKMGFYEQDPESEGYKGEGQTDTAGNLIQDAEPGSFELLPLGVKFSAWDPQHPNAAFKDFVKANLRGVASGLGVSYNSLANDLEGVSWSSGRSGAIEERDTWMALQEWFIDYIAEPVYLAWLEASLLAEAINIGKSPLKSSRYEKYSNVTWQAKRWEWVDPQKAMTANKMAWGLKLKSLSSLMRAQGDDPDEMWEECASDQAKLDKLGLTVVTDETDDNEILDMDDEEKIEKEKEKEKEKAEDG